MLVGDVWKACLGLTCSLDRALGTEEAWLLRMCELLPLKRWLLCQWEPSSCPGLWGVLCSSGHPKLQHTQSWDCLILATWAKLFRWLWASPLIGSCLFSRARPHQLCVPSQVVRVWARDLSPEPLIFLGVMRKPSKTKARLRPRSCPSWNQSWMEHQEGHVVTASQLGFCFVQFRICWHKVLGILNMKQTSWFSWGDGLTKWTVKTTFKLWRNQDPVLSFFDPMSYRSSNW